MQQRPPQRLQQRLSQRSPQQASKPCRSGMWNLITVLVLIAAASYTWPSILAAIEKGAYMGAKAGAEEGAKAAVKEAIKQMSPL